MMNVDAQVVAIEPDVGRSTDPAWQERAASTIAQLKTEFTSWKESTVRIGGLLEEVETEEFFRVENFVSMDAFLKAHGWDRRRCSLVQRAYRQLCTGPAQTAGLPDDVHQHSPPAIKTVQNEADELSTDASEDRTREAGAEFRRSWTVNPQPVPAPDAGRPQAAQEASAPGAALHEVSGGTDEQITKPGARIEEQPYQDRAPDAIACVDHVEALGSKEGDRFLWELVGRRNFLTAERVAQLVSRLISDMHAETLARVADALAKRCAEVSVDVSE